MHFKQLEIVGFKSFPTKTRVKFEPGVTAVVGPNGCGKSNIADAIRWVLGEQSPKSLRGASMEDVIFNGTNSIEPINMAEVSLTLSNDDKSLPIDYDEVIITRRLFRNGQSEYILNKTAVRLKDISDLLMGTGMGTSSYSVIEQNKIDMVLSSRPEDRRYIFEEASGITKFKAKKREGLRKLEHTSQNLVRIDDIINEVRRQINSIERHARKAERYRESFERLRTLDCQLAKRDAGRIESSLQENRRLFEALSTEEHALKGELEGVVSAIMQYRRELDETIRDMTDTQQQLSEVTLFVDKGRHKIELNKERIGELRSTRENSEQELSGLEGKIRLQEEEIRELRERFDRITRQRDENVRVLAEKEALLKEFSHEIQSHQRDIKEAKNRTVDLLAVQTKTKNDLIKLGADLQNRRSRLARLRTERENVAGEQKEVETLFTQAGRELEDCTQRVHARRDAVEALKRSLSEVESSLGEITRKITESENTLHSLRSKEEMLKEMIATFEGFEKGVKVIMEAVKNARLQGIAGIVADMVEPEDGYEVALEVALAEKAQAIVVRNRQDLEEALACLAENSGLAHFLILEEIGNENRPAGGYGSTGVAGIQSLSAFVKTAPEMSALLGYLLGDVFVAESLDSAYAAREMLAQGARIVTRDGYLVENGHLFGGSPQTGAASSIIGRAKKLEGIAHEKETVQTAMRELSGLCEAEKSRAAELKEKVGSAEQGMRDEEIELANAQSKSRAAEANVSKVNEEISIIELEISEVDEFVHEISLKGNELNGRLNENENEYARVQGIIAGAQEAIQQKMKAREGVMLEIPKIKSEISFFDDSNEAEKKNLNKVIRMLEEQRAQHESKKSDMLTAAEKISGLEQETVELEAQTAEKSVEAEELKRRFREVSERKEDRSRDVHVQEGLSRRKEQGIEEVRNRNRNTEMQIREDELKISHTRDRIRQAYKTDLQDVQTEGAEDANWEDVRNEVEVLRIKLEKLGPVNLVAIDELKELEERYSFLTQQREDLVRAKESLHGAIIKINRTTKKMFIETLQKIQVEFRAYFRMLFGGGHAELLLLDDGDVLESGIEIVVRPPGKKLQNLLLLSGGEKAMTAIALLFAIFKVKPSPFCILDEVDAPLDESNIGRFTRILQEFVKSSQFIVITHSKKTMEMANVLYGITMQEKGVSKIVSVKFAEEMNEKAAEKEAVLV
jgi:chromosome segregation protein